MKAFLIDTHALLWWLTDDKRLPRRSRAQIARAEARVLVSAASAWEVAIKKTLGKLKAPKDLLTVVKESGLSWIPVTPSEAYAAGCLPMHH
jgi:PIN domain nuclease of toxin-antitoxin system